MKWLVTGHRKSLETCSRALFVYLGGIQMDESYQYTTAEQQLQKLKRQKLAIIDEDLAKSALRTYGYYNIINGYRDPYITRSYGKKLYNAGVTFEQIFALFSLDHNIRNAVMLSMIDFEEHLRAVVSNIIGKDFGIDHKKYLNKNNYRDKPVNDSYFSRNKILGTLYELAEKSKKEPLQYYRNKYKTIPPWILLKGTYFGTLVNYIRLFKKPQREQLVKALYMDRITTENIDSYKDFLSDTLFLCLEYRNLTAHGGRVYNHIPKKNIRMFKGNNKNGGIVQLLFALDHLQYHQPFERLNNAINKSLNSYCHLYPNDITRLEQAIGIRITVENYVWANHDTQKYHTTQHCSGCNHNEHITLKHAREMGYSPCKKCCNNIIPIV